MSNPERETPSHLSALFPYDPSQKKHADLRKGLQEYRFLLQLASLAFQNLLDGHLEKFDALVGENACQIRAIKIAMIASKDISNYARLNAQIASMSEQIESLLTPKSMDLLMRDGQSLKELMDQHQLDIALSSEELFVVQAFILSEIKESNKCCKNTRSLCIPLTFLPKKLKTLNSQISSTFMVSLASRSRRLLSTASVNFVRKVAASLQNDSLLKMITECTIEHNTWPCTPMFWTYKTLLTFAQKQGIPLILHVKFLNETDSGFQVMDEEHVYFKPCPTMHRYIHTHPSEEDLMTPAYIIQGVAYQKSEEDVLSKQAWNKLLSQTSVIDVILAGAADHRQYPNPELIIDIEDCEYEQYKKLASQQGFSLENPSTFFIQHVYSSLTGNKSIPF